MSAMNGNSPHGSKSAVQVAAAQRFAEALVVGFAVCEEAGAPFSELQKVALIEAALLQFDGFDAQLTALSVVHDLLRDVNRNEHEN